MDKKTTQFNIVHGDNEYEIPEECEAAEEAAEELKRHCGGQQSVFNIQDFLFRGLHSGIGGLL